MKIIIILLFITSLSGSMVSRTQLIMATMATIKVDKKDDIYLYKAFEIMRNVENSLSSFKTTSPIFKLNQNKKIKLNKLTYRALELSEEYYNKTDGYFNITVGSITKDLYKFGENQNLPTKKDLDDAIVDFNGLFFDENYAKLKDGVKVDLGGMGKGFAVDKASEYLKNSGVEKAIISLSGDIRCLDYCEIQIINPHAKEFLLTFKTNKTNLGITTSGNYNRYVKNKINNHLINPKIKKSQQNFSSITLVGDIKSSALDAYATAVSVMPKKRAYRFLDSIGVGYIVVENGGKVAIKNDKYFELILNAK